MHTSGQVLDTYFPAPQLGSSDGSAPAAGLGRRERSDDVRGVRTEVVRVEIDLDAAPADTSDAYLRLHLLSHRLVAPRSINLDGIFGVCPTWSGPRPARARWRASRPSGPGSGPGCGT